MVSVAESMRAWAAGGLVERRKPACHPELVEGCVRGLLRRALKPCVCVKVLRMFCGASGDDRSVTSSSKKDEDEGGKIIPLRFRHYCPLELF